MDIKFLNEINEKLAEINGLQFPHYLMNFLRIKNLSLSNLEKTISILKTVFMMNFKNSVQFVPKASNLLGIIIHPLQR